MEVAADYLLDAPGADTSFGLATTSVTAFHPLDDRDRVFGGFRGGFSFENDAPLLYQFGLGGPFRLSSFDPDRFRGQRFLHVTGGYLWSVARLPDFLGGPIYAMGFFETGVPTTRTMRPIGTGVAPREWSWTRFSAPCSSRGRLGTRARRSSTSPWAISSAEPLTSPEENRPASLAALKPEGERVSKRELDTPGTHDLMPKRVCRTLKWVLPEY